MLTDFRKPLLRISLVAGFTEPHRKGGDQDTVARELGHSSTDPVQEVYGHFGTVRHRSEEVEYRVEQHWEILGERLESVNRLAGVASGTVSDTTPIVAW
jgi:hypothetical protein